MNSFSQNKLNAEKIKLIKIGMTSEKVISILGKPLTIENNYLNDRKTYTFTKPIKFAENYPMLWIHFDNNMKVTQVYAKKYILWGSDDESIYMLDSNNDFENRDAKRLETIFK